MLLSAEHLCINFGMRQLLSDVNFYLNQGDKIGIIGINGTGKSTFLKVLAGMVEEDSGTIARNSAAQISYLPQNPVMQDDASVLEQVFMHLSSEFQRVNEYEAKSMLHQLGISDFSQQIGTLSGGQRKRVALAASLIRPAEILILDEPTNHLDSEMTQWLENRLRRFKGGLIMVTHDRYFLERVANRITELSHGKLYHYEANYSKYLELKEQRQEMMQASERKRQSILRIEREWILRGCKARSTKSRERIQRYENLLNQDTPKQEESIQLNTAYSRLGKKLIELNQVCKSFDGRPVINQFSYHLLRDDRIGIVGHNGAGKTTLLNLFAGILAPDSGSVEIGSTVKIGYFTQEGREMDPNQRVYDFIHDISGEIRTNEGTFSAKQMLERFLFSGDMQSVPIGRLSGGERRRLYLLSILMEAPNILFLDEPTNDLDILTLSILEDYLQSFPGPILTVSHDRFFLDKIASTLFEVCGDGQVLEYSGNWSDWAAKRKEAPMPPKTPKKPYAERPRSQKLKFSFKEQREFESIDEDIAALEQQIADCEAEQARCSSDYVKLQELTQQCAELKAKLDQKTERWLYLTELKEKIDAQ